MKWLRWLLGTGGDTSVVDVKESTCCDTKAKDTKCCDPVVEGFVDEETGKSYKTAGALKGAQTRRKNKAKKSKKSKKAKK